MWSSAQIFELLDASGLTTYRVLDLGLGAEGRELGTEGQGPTALTIAD